MVFSIAALLALPSNEPLRVLSTQSPAPELGSSGPQLRELPVVASALQAYWTLADADDPAAAIWITRPAKEAGLQLTTGRSHDLMLFAINGSSDVHNSSAASVRPLGRRLGWSHGALLASLVTFVLFLAFVSLGRRSLSEPSFRARSNVWSCVVAACLSGGGSKKRLELPPPDEPEAPPPQFCASALQLAGCGFGVFVTHLAWGFLQERIMTQPYPAPPYYFTSSNFLVLSNRFAAVIISIFVRILTRLSQRGRYLPPYKYSFCAYANVVSSMCQYEMLKYVSFPVHVMAKSCTLLPSMLMGKFLNGTSYQWSQYGQAIAAMVCVTIMHLSEGHKGGGGHKQMDNSEMSDFMKFAFGASLLILFFACDSFTSQYQTSIYSKHKNLTKTQMMVCGNLVGLCITLISITAQFSRVRQSVAVVLADRAVLGRLVLLGLSAAMGQFCIYTAIKTLGPLAFTWIMTTRQLLSVLISLVLFGHGVSVTKLTCIFIVFAIMSAKQLAKAGTAFKKRAKCKARYAKPKASHGPTPCTDEDTGQDVRQWLNERAKAHDVSQAAATGNSVDSGHDADIKKEA